MKKQQIFRYLLLPLAIILYTCEDVDTTPPTVSISSHYSGQTVGEIVIIKVSTDDNDGVKKVEFYVNDELALTVSKSPFEFAWNTTELDDGDYVVKAIAYDNSGNSTESQPIMLTINNQSYKPSEVEIESIVFENGGFTVTWKKSLDNDFQSYQLEKSVESQMLDYAVIHTTNNIDELFFFDTDVNPLAYYYYRITVFDTVGLEQKGQILSSSLDPAPNPVNIKSVTYTYTDMTVEWDKSTDADFQEYKLLYSESQNGDKTSVDTYTGLNTTSYNTNDFDPTNENWYWIEVKDTLGQTTMGLGKSNIKDPFPKKVNITSVNYDLSKMTVKWTVSQDADFLNYQLLYALGANGIKDTLFTITDINTTEYTTSNFNPTINNWYWVVVTDYYNQQTLGNGKTNTIDAPPTASEISTIYYENDSFIINWTQNNDSDFKSYQLFESESENMSNKLLVFSTSNVVTTNCNIGIEKDKIRYYQLLTEDVWGLQSISDIVEGDSHNWFVKTFGSGVGNSVQQTTDGGYVIVGSKYPTGGGSAIWLIKTDTNGSEVLNKTFGGGIYNDGNSIQQTTDGGYIVVGSTYSYGEDWDLLLIKTDSNGYEVWSQLLDYGNDEYGNSVQQTIDGGYIITGRRDGALVLIKTDLEGNEVWNKTFGSGWGYSVQQTTDGGYIITGSSSGGSNKGSVLLVKTDSNGNEEWNKTFGGNSAEEGYSVQQTTDGGYIIAGGSESFSGNESAETWLIKTNSNGNEEWNNILFGSHGKSVQQTTDG
ncbi:MAG: hypothetical protein GWP19_13215, partial [Planctomycetia bacterium]|nr:hypothetical protein [Planctomycetia bacterium]